MTLSDISYDALKIAQRNSVIAEGFGNSQKSNIRTIQSDLFEKIEEKFDVIVSNPPYIETKTIQTLDKEVQMEPKLALDGGEDGLDLYRRIIKEAYKYLNNNGTLALEMWDNNSSLKQDEQLSRLLIREAFIKKGFINDPNKDYHLEILFKSKEKAEQLQEIIQNFGINIKFTTKNSDYMLYLKDGEEISSFLALMGANK